MHWDNECCHCRKGERMARVNHVWLEDDDVRAQEEYDSLFYKLDSDAKNESTQQDFHRPLQCFDFWVWKLFSHQILILWMPLLIKSPPLPSLFPQV
jgi:hypothetical protein